MTRVCAGAWLTHMSELYYANEKDPSSLLCRMLFRIRTASMQRITKRINFDLSGHRINRRQAHGPVQAGPDIFCCEQLKHKTGHWQIFQCFSRILKHLKLNENVLILMQFSLFVQPVRHPNVA